MHFRPAISALFTALLLVSGTGCQKSESRIAAAPPTVLPPETIASVHWQGKHWLGYEATAFFFMRIWNNPQTARLEKQTLTRLATTPGQWLPNGKNVTADAVTPLYLLLNDLVQEESYLEIRQPTNGDGETVFALRLNAAQTDSWLTNLPAVLQPLTGSHAVLNPVNHTWSLKTTNAFQFIQFTRVGGWTIISAGPLQNSLAVEITARIQHDGVPFVSAGTNLWLEANLDLYRLAEIFPTSISQSPSPVSHLSLAISGDGANVITRGNVIFSKHLPTSLEPWRLPVELMHEPLTSFTAARGLESWLTDWKTWRDLQAGSAPDQLFLWSLAGSPYQIYLAVPLTDVRSQAAALTDHLLQSGNPWLAANGYISFDRAPDGNGATWGNLPDIKPFIKSAGTGADGWLFAGLLPETNTVATPPPAGLIQDVLRRTNLVYYDWEVTGPRLQPLLSLGQTARLITRQPQMPMDSASINWLGLLIPRLGTSATIVNCTGPAELTFYRRSTLGFNAIELHLLANWLESSSFPTLGF